MKLLEFKIISDSGRRSHGTLAGTDTLKTEVVVVKSDTIKSKKYLDLYEKVILIPIPGLPINQESLKQIEPLLRMAKVLFSMDEAHLLKKTVVTAHRSPSTVQWDAFKRSHAEEIVKSVAGK